jgi:hypothetical protein
MSEDTKTSDLAFPAMQTYERYDDEQGRWVDYQLPTGGLSKREYFAAAAMQGMIAGLTKRRETNYSIIEHEPQAVAEISRVYADTLLAVLAVGSGK